MLRLAAIWELWQTRPHPLSPDSAARPAAIIPPAPASTTITCPAGLAVVIYDPSQCLAAVRLLLLLFQLFLLQHLLLGFLDIFSALATHAFTSEYSVAVSPLCRHPIRGDYKPFPVEQKKANFRHADERPSS